ncbi:cytochrome-c peroxidase [Planctomicrobium piriforme]|uniref:Cytochrome c peroxidase n=1 Tax=Planctomicrobium piriforme TaxID=1576369 RepID=A0A1I3NI82_9PLAN|nr:cytochrome c peroxidase [Planctomicrobium piriforme]SFJ09054.1 cytochrome c peroxidase [Planctomicrobium piriforme]
MSDLPHPSFLDVPSPMNTRFRFSLFAGGLAVFALAATSFVCVTAATPAKSPEPEEVVLGSGDLLTGIPGDGPLKLDEIKKWFADPKNNAPLKVKLPLGLAAGAASIKGIKENPLTRAKIELGRQLYFDPRLSADGNISCAFCHHPEEGYGKATQFGVGINGQQGGRNSPVSYNRILSDLQFWDGRAGSLEEQAIGPIANPIEMGNTHDACVGSLKKVPGYQVEFEAVFGKDSINIDNVAKAIAAFERAIVTGPAPFDYYEEMQRFSKLDPDDLQELLKDDPESARLYAVAKQGAVKSPMSDSAVRGRTLFFSERVNCAACHVGANLADEKYHNLGVGADAKEPDIGRAAVTKDEKDWGAFKTPTIRNVAQSPPYMHDGSQKTLMEVVEHYNKGGTPNKNLSDKIKKLNLTQQEKLDLVAFMEACTGPFPAIEHKRLPE